MNYIKKPFALFFFLISFSIGDGFHEDEQFGSFELNSKSIEREITFSNEKDNHVFCKQYENYLWIRFAESPEKDGESSDHLDIDIWNYSGPGTYLPADPKSNSRDGKRWNIWWHQEGTVYVNQANSSPCVLELKQEGEQLVASFSCKNLKLNDGDELMEVRNGSFRVTPVDGNSK